MIQMNMGDEIDFFIERFRKNPGKRAEIVDELIEAGRLTLNIPRSGLARRIAERLREGAFSDYYEFEKLLARALHPVLANLNLNAVADIFVNRLFSERYLLYARDVNIVLAAGGTPDPRALKRVIVRMAGSEGHYMVVKFYDLVLRTINPALAKSLKAVETTLIQMKKGLGEDTEMNRSMVRRIMGGFHGSLGDDAAEILLARMGWDDDLRHYVPQLAEESGLVWDVGNFDTKAPSDEMEPESCVMATSDDDSYSGDEPVEKNIDPRTMDRHISENAITRYARMIKTDYLDAVDPDDEGKIRGIIKGIYIKNEKVYNSRKAAETVKQVLALWLADASLDDRVRQVLEDIVQEEDIVEESPPVDHGEESEETEGQLQESGAGAAESDEDAVDIDLLHEEDPVNQGAISPEEQNALLDDIQEEHEAGGEGADAPHTMEESDGNGAIVDVAETMIMEELINDVSGEREADAPAAAPGHGEAVPENVIVSGDELDALLDDYSEEIAAEEGSVEPEADNAVSAESDLPGEEKDIRSLGHDEKDLRELSEEILVSGEELADDGIAGEDMEALLGDSVRVSPGDIGAADPDNKTIAPVNAIVSGEELDALLVGIDEDGAAQESPGEQERGAVPPEDSFLLDEGRQLEQDNPSEPSTPGTGDTDDYLLDEKEPAVSEEDLDETMAVENEEFVVKDELLFEDKSFHRRASFRERKKPAKVRITMRDIADTDQRKNLMALLDLLAEMDAAADVSRYLVGSGVGSEVKTEISKMLDSDNFDESLALIKNSDVFDCQEKIIILQRWLRPVSLRKGWVDDTHDERLDRIRKSVEVLAADMVKTDKRAVNESGGPDQEGNGSSLAGPDEKGNGAKLIEIRQKEMMKTGEESIRLSHEIEEFRDLYEAGIDDAAVAERIAEMQSFFDSLAAGDDGAVHFAVYHKPAFLSFLSFIDENPGLKDQLEIESALNYCKKKRIL
ncbi:MAG: hypothetical protein KA369_07235 [Spirochaetes bacterium]|nr:hypothetical protein [Spirochaetota bacterium]